MNNIWVVVITTITPIGGATLPFVIPSEAEGSVVQILGCNKFHQHPTLPEAPFVHRERSLRAKAIDVIPKNSS